MRKRSWIVAVALALALAALRPAAAAPDAAEAVERARRIAHELAVHEGWAET